MAKLSFGAQHLKSSPNFNDFIGISNVVDRNTSFNVVEEVTLEWKKASRSTKIIEKQCVIQGDRCIFKDVMIIA